MTLGQGPHSPFGRTHLRGLSPLRKNGTPGSIRDTAGSVQRGHACERIVQKDASSLSKGVRSQAPCSRPF